MLRLLLLSLLFVIACSDSNDKSPQFEDGTLALTPGSNTTELNLAWYSSTLDTKTVVRLFDADGIFIKTAMGTYGAASKGKLWHKVTLTDLTPGAKYKYSASSDSVNWSEEYDYSVPESGAFRFAIVGDPQLEARNSKAANAWAGVVGKIAEAGASFIVSAGDHVDNSNGDESEFKLFFAPPELRNIPFAPARGNHDPADLFVYHFNLPNEQNLASGNYFYLYNNILFIALNTAHWPGSKERAAEYVADFNSTIKEAKAANAGKYEWIIVHHHKSTRSVAIHFYDDDVRHYIEGGFDKLMAESGVDLVIAGHDHIYVRTREPKPVYLTVSTASNAKFYDALEEADKSSIAKYSQRNVPEYTIADVDGKNLVLKTFGLDGFLVDEFSL